MITLPVDPTQNNSLPALHEFLSHCRARARQDQHGKLVSISVTVGALDPLAVLESIFDPGEPHFYCERPTAGWAIAGAESAVRFTASGPSRFTAVQTFFDEVLQHTLAVGTADAAFGGPHLFAAFAFADQVEPSHPFPAALAFVPSWQVARSATGTTAVANLWIEPETNLDPLAERVWRAHAKFRAFDYRDESSTPLRPLGEVAAMGRVHETGDYRQAVAAALERIRSGEFEKIVLARALDVSRSERLHPLQMLNGLRQRFPDCFAFSVANGRGDSFIGATPERLARAAGQVLETDALAGTARRGRGAAEDAALGAALTRSEKDRREHAVVVESIRRRLAPLGLTLEHSAEPALLRLANVQHLHTPIRAHFPPGVRLLDALAQLHPTPAVGGSPRTQALQAIPQLEGFERGLYAGALGWMNAHGDGDFVVGIRSALVRGTEARVFAGAGIVAGSDPDAEYAETELKFRALLDALLAG